MSKKPTTAEAVLLVAAAIKELKDAQKAHQAAYQEAQTAFKQEVMDTLATVTSRDEVRQMIAEAELDDLTLEQVQEKILAAVADKAAKQAVDEANREQDARIAALEDMLSLKDARLVNAIMAKIKEKEDAEYDERMEDVFYQVYYDMKNYIGEKYSFYYEGRIRMNPLSRLAVGKYVPSIEFIYEDDTEYLSEMLPLDGSQEGSDYISRTALLEGTKLYLKPPVTRTKRLERQLLGVVSQDKVFYNTYNIIPA